MLDKRTPGISQTEPRHKSLLSRKRTTNDSDTPKTLDSK